MSLNFAKFTKYFAIKIINCDNFTTQFTLILICFLCYLNMLKIIAFKELNYEKLHNFFKNLACSTHFFNLFNFSK